MDNIAIDAFTATAGLSGDPDSDNTRTEVDFIVSALALPSGADLLDLPCGNGRHAAALGRRGFRVTAVDASAECIALARRAHGHADVDYLALDVNAVLELGRTFDAVVSLYSCVGYLGSDAENEAAARALVSVLRPGGRLILSTANRTVVGQAGANTAVFTTGNFQIERRDVYDDAHAVLERRFHVLDRTDNTERTLEHRRRLYSEVEMRDLLRRCGLGTLSCVADYSGAPFVPDRSPHAIYVGTRADVNVARR